MRPINRRVNLLVRMGERFINRKLAGSGVSSGTGIILLELRDGGDRNPAALAAAMGVDKAYVTRSLQSLQQAGYVAVSPDTSDRRLLNVSLTEKGRAATRLIEEAMRDWLALVSQGVSPSDLDTVEAVFDTFYANAVVFFAGEPKHD